MVQEYKFLDLDNTIALSSGGDISNILGNIAQGAGEQERIGRYVTVKSLQMRWNMRLNETTLQHKAHSVHRVIIFCDNQCNKALPVVLDVLETADFQAYRNLSNTGRFQIYYDKTFAVAADAAGGNGTLENFGRHEDFFDIKIPLNKRVSYTLTTGAIGERTSANFVMLTIQIGGLGECFMDYNLRLRYVDGQ